MTYQLAVGTVTLAYRTTSGSQAMVYDVKLDDPGDFGYTSPSLSRVPCMQSGFSPITPSQEFFTGIVFAPENGARVIVALTSSGPFILGYLSGPISNNQPNAPECATFNPGIDTAEPRTTGSTVDVPGWAMGVEPGDVSIGKFSARLKFNTFGAFLGSGPGCFTHYGNGGNRIDKWVSRDERGIGYWGVSRSITPVMSVTPVATTGFETAPSACWHISSYDIDPDPLQLLPYLIEQRGFISGAMAEAGKGSAELAPILASVVATRNSPKTVVSRKAVVRPLTVAVTPTDEVIAPLFDERVTADGSWSVRSGNRASSPTWLPGFELSYDAVLGTFVLRVGEALGTVVTINNGDVAAVCSSLSADVAGSAKVSARSVEVGAAEITLKSASVIKLIGLTQGIYVEGDITCTRSVKAAISVEAPLVSATAVTANGIPLSTHTHSGVKGGPDMSGPPVA